MRKVVYVNRAISVALLLLVMVFFLSEGVAPHALDSEKRFMAGLHNSLYYLDRAKQEWAKKGNKSEQDTPSLPDLMPYIGGWKSTIERFTTLGVKYGITSMAEPQSDVVMLTRDLRFRRGFCRYYPAGTSYGLKRGWGHPKWDARSSFWNYYIHNWHRLAVVWGALGLGNLIVFVISRPRSCGCLVVRREIQNP
jgi:hypothetical protein